MTMEPVPEFVTISRASILLEAPERTVRRMAAKLADTDRQLSATGARLVRLSALAASMGKELPLAPVADTQSDLADVEEQDGRQVADTSEALADKEPGLSATFSDLADAEKRAAVAEARAELLERELADWKGQAREAMELARAAQDEVRAVRALSSRSTVQIEAAPTPGGSHSSPEGSGGVIPLPVVPERPWWQFWRR